MDAELSHQRLFCYRNHLVIDAYLSGCMYNSIQILKVWTLQCSNVSVVNHTSWRVRAAPGRLFSDRFYQLHRSLFSLGELFFHAHDPHRGGNGGRARPRHFHDFLHQALVLRVAFSVGFGKSSVVTVELGRCFASTSVTLLLSAAPNRRPLPWAIPVRQNESNDL